MNVVWLMRYISGISILGAVVSSAITYHPDIQRIGLILPPAFAGIALLGFGCSMFMGRLPGTHWIHQSSPIRYGLVVVAVTITLLVVMVG